MDYSQLESFLATSVPTPEFNKPPFKLEVLHDILAKGYSISLRNADGDLGMQIQNEGPEGYDHALKIFEALTARWNGMAVLSKGEFTGAARCNLIDHALREFQAVGYPAFETLEEGPDKWIQQNILQLLYTFSEQGHSGSSAPFAISAFSKLANFEPLGPLTGADSEWIDPDGSGVLQNTRCGHVFKGIDGRAYDTQGKIFREPNGECFQSADSRVYISFPYTPTPEYVDVPALEGQE